MACTPLVIGVGDFIDADSIAWSTAPSQSAELRTVTRTTSGISVQTPSGSVFHPTLASYTSKYMFFGSDNYLLILDIEGGPGSSTRHVTLIDFTTSVPTERHILTVLATSNSVPAPNVQYSQGTGAAFLVFASNGTEITNCKICRSSNGAMLCAGPPPWVASGVTQGSATATQLRIHWSSGGTSHLVTCPKPQGRCDVDPALQTFPVAVVGGPSSLATTTDEFTIRNTGTDCLTITSIGSVTPFMPTTTVPLPVSLAPSETLVVKVAFGPSAVGTYDRTLPVTRTPAVGDSGLVCRGTAREPTSAVALVPPNLDFGSVRVGDSPEHTARVRNTGELPVTVSWAGSPSGPFSWSEQLAFSLAPTVERPLPVTFAPLVEGPATGAVVVDHNATTGSHSLPLSGSGCIPNAVMAPPPTMPISFGTVQRGFRMVRFVVVRNTGDAPLTFTASISGPDAALYRLVDPQGSITGGTATRSYVVDPQTSCGAGATGPGSVIVAVVFHADRPPGATTAQLVLGAHNGSNASPATYTFPLSAEVVAGIPVDAVAVFDRSGSMVEPAGVRTKSEVAVSAGGLFAQLIREGVDDRLALVKFDDVPEVVSPMTVVTAANHVAIVDTITAAALAPRGSTGIAGGLDVAFREIASPRATVPAQLTKAVVVLTDGKDNTPYLDPDDGRWYSLLGGMVDLGLMVRVATEPVAVPSGVRVYGIGLGNEENIDHGRLDALTGSTGGYFGIVGTDLTGPAYFNLEKYFTQVYMNMVGTSPLLDPVFTILPGETHRIDFDVLRGDVGALVVLYDKDGMCLPFHLESPTGELIEASSVPPGFQLRSGATGTARFVEFLLPAGEPERYAGRWAVVVVHPKRVCFGPPTTAKRRRKVGRQVPWGFVSEQCRPYADPVDYGVAIGVGSNLRMQPYVTPGIVHVGTPITLTAVITEMGLPVLGAQVTVHVESPSGDSWSVELRDDGAHNDGTGADGEYGRLFVHTYEAGSYQLTFRADALSRDKEPVTREAMLAKYVEGRLPIAPEPVDPSYKPPTEDDLKAVLDLWRQRRRVKGPKRR